jgi:hypothetical protein
MTAAAAAAAAAAAVAKPPECCGERLVSSPVLPCAEGTLPGLGLQQAASRCMRDSSEVA